MKAAVVAAGFACLAILIIGVRSGASSLWGPVGNRRPIYSGPHPALITDTSVYLWRRAHRAALRYRRERDHLQDLLAARVAERNRLRQALRRRLAVVGGSPVERAFLCIHSFEGAWTADTGNGFHGGLQMNAGFEETYGADFLRAWGHANHWPVSVQLAVAIRGWLNRGFAPWPVTRRECGV